MAADNTNPRNDPAPLSDEPSEPDPGLQWWKGWAQGSPLVQQIFTPPPNIEQPGEVEEVRIRRTGREGAYMLQIGFRPRTVKHDA